MRQQHRGTQEADFPAKVQPRFRQLRQLCRNLVTVMPLRQVPNSAPEAEPQGNAMSVRITAAGAVAFFVLSFLAAPVSACDERFIKKCEKAAAAAAAAVAAAEEAAPVAKRKSSGRVQVVVSRRVKHMRLAKRVHAPAFATRGAMVLTSAESRMTTPQPESALARRFRGFINPMPIAQNTFEALRKPHVVSLNLEPPVALPQEAAPVAALAPAQSAAIATVVAAKQDRITPQPAATQPAMELASAESKRVTLPDPAAKPAVVATANAATAPQAFFSATQPAPDEQKPSGFPVHQLVIALCGALGAASALRFIVGA
jgi:hypothetical protein